MKKRSRLKQVFKYALLSIGVFAFSVIISMLTRMILVSDSNVFGFSESQAALVASMLEAIVGALSAGLVVYQLRAGDIVEERQSDIEEAKFILEYNQSFIQDDKMYTVEQQLEQEMLKLQHDEKATAELITNENRQQFINYLVYLEGLAPLILRGVLQLEHIDDLMAYRFFLAMNNPVLQEDQLKVFPEYYRGCYKLYEVWKKYRLERGKEIINAEFSLDKWEYYREFASDIVIRNMLPTDDKKAVAELIYKTDPYIYPTAFGRERNAKIHLSRFFDIENNPFNKNNIRVAVQDNEVIGIAVVLQDKPAEIYQFEDYASIHSNLPKNYLHTAEIYFNSLYEYIEDANDVYIPCICVKEKDRSKHIGEMLLMNTVRNNSGKNIHLHVLCDNDRAIRLYKRCGFQIIEQVEGYSLSNTKPQCFKMSLLNEPNSNNLSPDK